MFRFIWALAALSLTGCPSGNPHTDDTDTGTDTDTDDPSQMARLTVNVTLLGAPEPCFVRLNGEMEGPSGQELEVNPGSYTLTVGSDEMTADGLPIHRDAENVPWVAVPSSVTLAANSDEVEEVALNRYFNGAFNCVEERYEYDASAPDFKGSYDDTVYWDEMTLTVEDGELVNNPGAFIAIEQSDSLMISGNAISWHVNDGDTERHFITENSISVAENGNTIIHAVFVNAQFDAVSDVTCEEE